MPAMLMKIGMSMLMSLVTEKFAKTLAVRALRALAKKTASTTDDEIAEDIAAAWGVE
jgi:hypothetical protein